ELLRETERFRPWVVLDRLDDLLHLGDALCCDGGEIARAGAVSCDLDGHGALRSLVSADSYRTLNSAILTGATERLGRPVPTLRELGPEAAIALPLDEQYLVATGRTYFRDLTFDQLRRLQFDLETTGLDPRQDRIFMVAVRDPAGATEILEADDESDSAEAELIRRLVAKVEADDPD